MCGRGRPSCEGRLRRSAPASCQRGPPAAAQRRPARGHGPGQAGTDADGTKGGRKYGRADHEGLKGLLELSVLPVEVLVAPLLLRREVILRRAG